MKCTKCNAEIADNAKFCQICGAKVEIENKCPNCGATIKKDAKFCPECGDKIEKECKCPKCGTIVADGVKFCPKCGTKVNGDEDNIVADAAKYESQAKNTTIGKSATAPSGNKKSKINPKVIFGIVGVAIVALVLVIVFCFGGKGGSTPTEAAENYYELLKKGDFKAAVNSTYEYNKEMTEEEKEFSDAMLDMTASKLENSMNEKGGIKDYAVYNESVYGFDASVVVVIYYGNGEKEEYYENLKKVGDRWYIFNGDDIDEDVGDGGLHDEY